MNRYRYKNGGNPQDLSTDPNDPGWVEPWQARQQYMDMLTPGQTDNRLKALFEPGDTTMDMLISGQKYDNLSFDDAFALARQSRVPTFTWRGKSYHTNTAEEVSGLQAKQATPYKFGGLHSQNVGLGNIRQQFAPGGFYESDWYTNYMKAYQEANPRPQMQDYVDLSTRPGYESYFDDYDPETAGIESYADKATWESMQQVLYPDQYAAYHQCTQDWQKNIIDSPEYTAYWDAESKWAKGAPSKEMYKDVTGRSWSTDPTRPGIGRAGIGEEDSLGQYLTSSQGIETGLNMAGNVVGALSRDDDPRYASKGERAATGLSYAAQGWKLGSSIGGPYAGVPLAIAGYFLGTSQEKKQAEAAQLAYDEQKAAEQTQVDEYNERLKSEYINQLLAAQRGTMEGLTYSSPNVGNIYGAKYGGYKLR